VLPRASASVAVMSCAGRAGIGRAARKDARRATLSVGGGVEAKGGGGDLTLKHNEWNCMCTGLPGQWR
jgi:hypothetical protein